MKTGAIKPFRRWYKDKKQSVTTSAPEESSCENLGGGMGESGTSQ